MIPDTFICMFCSQQLIPRFIPTQSRLPCLSFSLLVPWMLLWKSKEDLAAGLSSIVFDGRNWELTVNRFVNPHGSWLIRRWLGTRDKPIVNDKIRQTSNKSRKKSTLVILKRLTLKNSHLSLSQGTFWRWWCFSSSRLISPATNRSLVVSLFSLADPGCQKGANKKGGRSRGHEKKSIIPRDPITETENGNGS